MVTGSERLGPLSDYNANCRPILSSERAPHRNKTSKKAPRVMDELYSKGVGEGYTKLI
jgi:hypothetical protein